MKVLSPFVQRAFALFLLGAFAPQAFSQRPFRVLYDFTLPKVPVVSLVEESPLAPPVINDHDQTAFVTSRPSILNATVTQAYRTTGSTREVINSQSRSRIPIPGSSTSGSQVDSVSINNSGDVAYSILNYTTSQRTVELRQGSSSTLVGTFGSSSTFSWQALNDLDQVLIKQNSPTAGPALLWESGSTSTLFSGQVVPSPALLNNAGVVAMGPDGMGSPNPLPLYLQNASDPLNNIAEPGYNYTPLSLNQAGQLLVNRSLRGSSQTQLYVMSLTAPPVFLVEPVGASYANGGSMNDLGYVAYLTSTTREIYFFAPGDPSAARLMGVGDAYGGSTVTALRMSGDAINNRNRVAFSYELANDTNGILVIAVPEASSRAMGMVVVIMSGGLALRRKCRFQFPSSR